MSNRNKKAGLPPGSIVFTGSKKVEQTLIHYLKYNTETFEELELDTKKEVVLHQSKSENVDWYDLRGIHDTDLVEQLGQFFTIHALVLEDIVDIYQRPKFEEFENGNFIILKSLSFDEKTLEVSTEQVAIYFGDGFLISFQEDETDLFVNVRNRVKSGKGKIKTRGSDYLAYAILDNVIDSYFVVLEKIENRFEEIEEGMILERDIEKKQDIHKLKRELMVVRKSIAPLREAIGRFSKAENLHIQESTEIFVRDLYNNTIQALDMVESYRDILNGLQELYISQVSFKMNKVMQMLTIVSTIFIPITFLAGIYGMNFDLMPELHWKYSYPALLFSMVLITVITIIYFKRKRWL